MTSLAGFQIVRKVHSQPKADILLCLSPSSNPADEDAPVVVKHIHLGARSPTACMDPAQAAVDAAHEGVIVQRLLALPAHANIARYHAVVDQPKAQLIVMDYCPHGDLLAWLHQQPDARFAEHDALAIFEQILRGVHFLHTNGIAHCDLSLENFLVTSDRSVRICDFGLACDAARRSGQRIGKLNYMAPEVVRGDVYDPVQADVWSLGIVLFMLLTGSPLFEIAVPEDPAYVCIQRLGVEGVLENWGLASVVRSDTVELLGAMLQVDYARRLRSVAAILDRMRP